MKPWHWCFVFLLALAGGFIGGKAGKDAPHPSSSPQSAYSRIVETRTLRCGYASLPPFVNVSATGEISGPTFDIMNEASRRLGLKVEWTEETGYGQISEGLQSHRFDAFCGVLWATSVRASALLFTQPTHYLPVYPCVTADSTAYDNDTAALNDPEKTFAAYDGDISRQLAEAVFPKAKIMTVSPMTSAAEWMEQVASGKADAIATCDKIFAAAYDKNNPGKIKIAAPEKPLTYVRVVFGLPQNDFALKSMIDQALFEMTADGTIARIMHEKLGTDADALLLPQGPAR